MERRLLPAWSAPNWLRVVIAGQRLPDRAGAVWASRAFAPFHLQPPLAADWLELGKRYRNDLTLAMVKNACHLARHKASVLALLMRMAN